MSPSSTASLPSEALPCKKYNFAISSAPAAPEPSLGSAPSPISYRVAPLVVPFLHFIGRERAPRKVKVRTMTRTRTLVVLAVTLLAVSALLQAEQREYVTRGEVLSVSVEDGTLTMTEIAEPPETSRPGTMQSGVVRRFTVTANTDVMTAQGQSIELGQIRPGAQVTIHFVLDSGKNVAKAISVTSSATE